MRVRGFEIDALWTPQRVVCEADGFAYHGHRAAFERDRARDAALQAAGYAVVGVTWRQLAEEEIAVAAVLGGVLGRSAG